MTKLRNFFQNPFNAAFEGVKEAAKIEAGARTAKQANELFRDKPFAVENKTTYTIAKIIGYVANVVSFATGFFALQNVLGFTVGYVVASLGALLLCGLLEWLKNSTWKTNVKAALKYRKPSVLGGAVLLLLSLFSIAASGYGAYLLPTQISQPTPVPYSKNDSLVIRELETINGQISNLDRMFLETSAKAIPNEKGQISSTIKGMLKSQTAQKDSLSSQKRAITAQIAALTAKQAENEKQALTDHKNGLFNMQISCLVVALLFELIYTLCAVYCFYYLFRVYVDSGEQSSPNDQPNSLYTPTANDQHTPHQHTPTNQKRIGFFNDLTNDQPTEKADKHKLTNPHLTNDQTDLTNGFTTVLKPLLDGQTETENGIKFVWHNKKKYTKADVQNNVWAFRSKVKNYEQTDLTKAAKYKQHLARWETYLISIS